jgi:N6-L-threonylcarbamoyladenine synthase
MLTIVTFLSEDLGCIGAGLLVAGNVITIWVAFIVIFVGILIVDTGIYWIGRIFGRPVIRKAPFKWLISKKDIKSPVVCLTVSGGHTDLLYFKEYGDYEILGRTKDDAAGEAFDKIARYLGLGYPGGPVIEQKAKEGNEQAVDFPRPFIDKDNYDFSFSGLKTAVINYIHNQKQKNIELNINDIAASFQKAVIDILTNKTIKAALSKNAESVILSGGVAANKRFREVLESSLKKYDIPLYFPEMKLCTDNAAMISTVAYYQYLKKDFATHDLNADPNLKL